LEKQGVHWHLGRKASAIHHAQHGYTITLDNGESLHSDLVFSAIGLRPRIALAKHAGIHTHRGIIVDHYLRTNVANIYAMGDCAEINDWILPYIAPIMQCAKALGQTLTGHETAVSLPAMAVIVKTSCYPIVVCRPPHALPQTDWQFEEHNETLRAYLKDNENKLCGFILTKEAVKERMALAQTLEKWL
jgi:rubredoxin-NAD+ reductase